MKDVTNMDYIGSMLKGAGTSLLVVSPFVGLGMAIGCAATILAGAACNKISNM